MVLAAWLRKIPVVAHESDTTPGLANRLAFPFVDVLCTTFDTGADLYQRVRRVVHTGTPVRSALFHGKEAKGRLLCGASEGDRILLVVGGSLGSEALNTAMRRALPDLCQTYYVVHVCGKGHLDAAFESMPRYRQFEFVSEGWGDLLAASEVVLSRAGANALHELLMLGKPNILVPLSARASRGDQIENARWSERLGLSLVIAEQDLSTQALLATLGCLESERERFLERLSNFPKQDGSKTITDILLETARR